MKPDLRLVVKRPHPKSTDRCLAKLTDSQKRGDVTGLGFVAYLANGRFIADACGEAHNNPERTLRMLEVLRDKLQDRVPKQGAL